MSKHLPVAKLVDGKIVFTFPDGTVTPGIPALLKHPAAVALGSMTSPASGLIRIAAGEYQMNGATIRDIPARGSLARDRWLVNRDGESTRFDTLRQAVAYVTSNGVGRG